MRAKVLILGLICFFIFSFCEKGIENPYSPTPPIVVLNPPTIVSFTSSNPDHDRYITVSWEVKNATKIILQNDSPPYVRDVSHLPIGTLEVEVCGSSPWDATTMEFSLIAYNDDGNVREDIVIASATAKLGITTIPAVPIFIYQSPVPDDSSKDYYRSLFDLIVTETNGVGGSAIFRFYKDSFGTPWIGGLKKTFEPFESWSSSCNITVKSKPTFLCIQALIDDNNGFWTEPFVKIFLLAPN